ncbi:hypothetical protein HLB35_06115 [Halomonas sp. TBZ9]|uniref:Secreted protein n=1 Tax=Vreelandella azerica TaxID=2732867 RepID=A0A7Y3TX95_9GAMM|nr:hypothetical protein [Halomonas azerica]NOG31450.1 hypothetical protein [Halomonas azerica]
MNRRTFLASGLASAGLLMGTSMVSRLAQADTLIKLRDLYARDRGVSDLALSLEGKRITVDGFMAPPLKAESEFFVLTRIPMAVCPFCETEADWPDDILAVYTKRTVDVVPFNIRLQARGVLELGPYRDPETGFLSMVRLADASYS